VGVIPIVNRLNKLFLGDYERQDLSELYEAMIEMPMKKKLTLAKSDETVNWLDIAKAALTSR